MDLVEPMPGEDATPLEYKNPNYCVAIRGNGENAPAHWAGLARIVEEQGIPKGAAGGSSATVTMFFLDSMASNPLLKNEKDPEKKKQMMALMLKSLPQFVQNMAKADGLMGAYNFAQELGKVRSDTKNATAAIMQKVGELDPEQAQRALAKYGPLLNPEMLRGLASNPAFFKGEAQQGLAVFGKFDAQADDKLFFRPGIVDFKSFSVVLGNIADFYAGNIDDETKAAMNSYTKECSKEAFGKSWRKLPEEGCKKRFEEIVGNYMKKGQFQNKALFNKVGEGMSALPTTSLVHGEGLKKYQELKASYDKGEDKNYKDFSVDFNKDVSFGYWGTKQDLQKAEKGLAADKAAGDLKAQKFQAIGPGNWFEVLATSPAEPGLANFQAIPTNTSRDQVLAEMQKPALERWGGLQYRKDALSAGGWSDLAPTGVLKAKGCESVTYLTRKGGDTIFGQQVMIRLSGDKDKIPFWGKIRERNAQGWGVKGTAAEDTTWNKLSNRGNLRSSLMNSLRKADKIYCTDWDSFNPFGGEMWPMVHEAYEVGYVARKNEAGCAGTPLERAVAGQEDPAQRSAE